MPWRNKPRNILAMPADATHSIFIDESGNSNLEPVKKIINAGGSLDIGESHFTTTAVIIRREDFVQIKNDILGLKYKYWEDGMYTYNGVKKRVCFHSREIRNKKGPFHDSVIDHSAFVSDLTDFLVNSQYNIISATINKDLFVRRYSAPWYTYGFMSDMIFERLAKHVLQFSGKGAVMIESRGKNEDTILLKSITDTLADGTPYVTPRQLERIIGVYFNEKWCRYSSYTKSHFGLEIADLVSHPIHQYARSGNKNAAFLSIESKLHGYPLYSGKGLKIFP